MRRWADLIRANADDLAAICTLELGKPFTESLVTVKVLSSHLPPPFGLELCKADYVDIDI